MLKEDYYALWRQYIEFSLAWRWRRTLRRELDNESCRGCGSWGLLHCHHLTYDNVFMEEMKDLTTLCEDCHNEEHEVREATG